MTTQEGLSTAIKSRTHSQKRSQKATLVLMGATPFVVLGLDPLHTDVRIFRDVHACESALTATPGYCESLRTEAQARHPALAPKYESRDQCEADFAHVINDQTCKNGWCGQHSVIGCEATGDGHYRPAFSSFLVDQSVVSDTFSGETPAPSSLAEGQLQPVYGVSENTLQENSDHPYYGHSVFLWHYVTPGGQYLGPRSLNTPVTLARTQLTSGPGQTFSGNTRRGGFGATARRTMQAARS